MGCRVLSWRILVCYSRERNVLLVPKTNGRDSTALSLRGHTALHQKLEGKKVEEKIGAKPLDYTTALWNFENEHEDEETTPPRRRGRGRPPKPHESQRKRVVAPS